MYKICICDDKADELIDITSKLEITLNELHIEYQIEKYSSSYILKCELDKGKHFDVFFLDILMPKLNGMELAKIIRETDGKCIIVFITSSKDYAISGYKVGAVDYLTKPFEQQELNDCIQRILLSMKKTETHTVKLNIKGSVVIFNVWELIYIESQAHYIYFYFSDGTSKKLYGSLANVTPVLENYNFIVRCHKSFFINLKHVKKHENNKFILNNGNEINISRQHQVECKSRYSNYIADKFIYKN